MNGARKKDIDEFVCAVAGKHLSIRDIEAAQKYMQRVTCMVKDARCGSNAFYAQAHLVAGGLLRCLDMFSKAIKEFHDRSGQAQSDRHPS